MPRGVNKVILVGYLGNDPEVRYSAGGMAFAKISLATNHSIKNKQTGEWQEATEWHRVAFFDRLAEVAGEYLRKGSQIYVEGRLQTQKWQDQQGQDRWTTEVVANEMIMLGGRDSGTASYAQPGGGGGYAPSSGGPGGGGGYAPSPGGPGGGGGNRYPPPQSQQYAASPPQPQYAAPQPQYGAAPPSPPSSAYEGQYNAPPPPPSANPGAPPPMGANNPPSKGFDDDIPF